MGNKTEGMILAALLRLGHKPLIPFGGGWRYDLVFEDAASVFWRVQCKTGRLLNGAVTFRTASDGASARIAGGRNPKSYKGEADFFGIYCPTLDKVYLVPVDDVRDSAGSIRIDPPKNNQVKGIRWARDYEVLWGYGAIGGASEWHSEGSGFEPR